MAVMVLLKTSVQGVETLTSIYNCSGSKCPACTRASNAKCCAYQLICVEASIQAHPFAVRRRDQ